MSLKKVPLPALGQGYRSRSEKLESKRLAEQKALCDADIKSLKQSCLLPQECGPRNNNLLTGKHSPEKEKRQKPEKAQDPTSTAAGQEKKVLFVKAAYVCMFLTYDENRDCSSTNGSRHVAPVGRSCRSSKDFEN